MPPHSPYMSPDTPSTSASAVANAPWPGYTSPPTAPPPPSFQQQQEQPPQAASKKRRHRAPATPALSRRQIVADQNAVENAKQRCQSAVGNEVISCYPTYGALVPQNQWATFVWNSQLPQWAQTNLVDVHLFREDTGQPILSWLNQVNPPNRRAGVVTAQVNDTWYGDQGDLWSPDNGKNVTFPLYFVIVRSDQGLASGNYIPQPAFTAVQTTYADYIAVSISSASVSSALSASSVAATQSTTRTGSGSGSASTGSGTGNPSSRTNSRNPSATGNIQDPSSDHSFPRWAIAVIVVLGVLAIVAAVLLAWLVMRRMRRRREQEARRSTSSGTPMLAGAAGGAGSGADEPKSPLTTEDAHEKTHLAPSSAAAMAGASGGAYVGDKHGDGASTISRAHSESAPFSGADAAIMADAFRKALRKPDFAGGGLEEGDTPESAKERREAELLSRELAEEGRDIRSVASSRNVRVDHARDDGSTFEGR